MFTRIGVVKVKTTKQNPQAAGRGFSVSRFSVSPMTAKIADRD